MKRLVCRVIGHRWQPLTWPPASGSVCLVCLRCRENAWEIW